MCVCVFVCVSVLCMYGIVCGILRPAARADSDAGLATVEEEIHLTLILHKST